ncbi:MAG: preprotein translocase subunit SecE [Gammaproteobacteria bacterium]|jgi:preprotein translocase SecE subunit|nr:preprotein translocase subunit SecE [Gammaproteobacteria bacterium]
MGRILDYFYYIAAVAMFVGGYLLTHMFHISNAFAIFFLYLGIILASFALFLLTNAGKLFKKQAREAQDEVYKIFWPDFNDVLKTSLMVAVAVSVIGLLLYLLDSFLMNLYNVVL